MTPALSQGCRILLIDDHVLFRVGLRHLLEKEGNITVVGEASSLAEAVAFFANGTQFDLALIDYQLDSHDSNANSLAILRMLHDLPPSTRIIMLTGGLPNEAFLEIVKQHRAGIFFKTEPLSDLVEAIRRTLQGEVTLSPEAREMLVGLASLTEAPVPLATFSPRELMVLRSITEGLANKEIAVRLESTETNVKAILQRIFEKTGVRSRSQLVRYVFEFNLELP